MNRNTPAQPTAQDDGARRQPMTGEQGNRFMDFRATSYDADTRSVELVASMGTSVDRRWFFEELEISDAAIDLSRVERSLCNALDSHNQYEAGAVVGKIRDPRIQGGALIVRCFFGETDHARLIEGMVARGELTGVSVGYMPKRWELISTDPETDKSTWRCTRWELLEVSFVSVPADPNSGVRSAPGSIATPGTGISAANDGDEDMNRNLPGGAGSPAPASAAAPAGDGQQRAAEPPAAAPAAAPAAPAGDGQQRAVEPPAAAPAAAPAFERFSPVDAIAFVDQARSLGVETQGRELIERNAAGTLNLADARSALLSAAAAQQGRDTANVQGGPTVRVTDTNAEASRSAIVDALSSRILGQTPPDPAREFMRHTLLDIARERAGLNPRERDDVVIMRAAMATSDFPIILEATANRVMMARYASAPTTFRRIARQRDLTDFKATKLLRIGDFPTLLKYNEDGEIKYGTINEGSEAVILGSYGRNIRLTRQAIINDDLNAFDDVIGSIGQMIATFENDTFYAVKASNPKLSDGTGLFHANHGNLAASGGGITVANVGAGRAAMRKQKNLDGKPINIAPSVLLVGPDKETEGEQFLAPIAAVQQTEINPFAGRQSLELVVDATITGNQWELYAAPSQLPVFHFGYLANAPGPRILTQEGFDFDGVGFSVREDFYAGVTDYRGAWRNPGN